MVSGATLMALALAAPQPAGLEVKVLRTVTVHESAEDLNFPWVFRGPGGFLSLGCSTGRHTVAERGMALVSEDDGETWAKPTRGAIGGMGTLLRDGRSVVLSCWGPKPDAEGAYPVATLFYSRGGRELQEKVAGKLMLPFPMPPHFHRSVVEMPDGRLLATIYGRREGQKKYTSALIATEDGGKSWRFVSVIAHSEEVGAEGFCEPALVRLANGDILCALRVGGPLYTCRSSDEGRTWTQPLVVADHGVCAHLLLMRNGVLVLSFGRPNVDLLFSPDGTGKEWTGRTTLYRGMGCSYTSLVEAGNGDLMVFFTQSAFCGTPGPGPLNMLRLARLSVRPQGAK